MTYSLPIAYRYRVRASPPIGRVKNGRKFVQQAQDMQDVMYLLVTGNEATPAQKASCARAWSDIEERKREMLGKGKPRPVEEKKRNRGSSKPAQPAGPVVYPMPSEESAPAVVNDNVEKPSEDGPKE